MCDEEPGPVDWGLAPSSRIPKTLPPWLPRDVDHITTETGDWDPVECDEAPPVSTAVWTSEHRVAGLLQHKHNSLTWQPHGQRSVARAPLSTLLRRPPQGDLEMWQDSRTI